MSTAHEAALLHALACARPSCLCQHAWRGLTHCPAHADHSPSLSLTVKDGRLLVICRAGCRQDEVLTALRARGLWGSEAPRRWPHSPTPGAQARAEVLRRARRAAARLAPYAEVFAEADSFRLATQTIARARVCATTLGDTEAAWALLAVAAQLETATYNAESPDGGHGGA